MNKTLIIIISFVFLLLAGLYFAGPSDREETITKEENIQEEFFTLDSAMKSRAALFKFYGDKPAVPDIAITDEKGQSLTLNDMIEQNKGQRLLVNFWATWCVPCREEMPELDALQAAMGSGDFKVIIISVDRGGLEASRKFLDEIGIKNLALYYDEKGILARKMKTIGYPTTVLINKDGKQFGILTGPAHWNGTRAHSLIDRLIADQ